MSLPNIKDFSYSEDTVRDYEIYLNRSFNLANDNIIKWLFLYLTDKSVNGEKIASGYRALILRKIDENFQLAYETERDGIVGTATNPIGNAVEHPNITNETTLSLLSDVFLILLEMYKSFPEYYHTVLDSVCTKKVFWQQLEEYFNILMDPFSISTTNPYEDSDELIF